MEKYRKFDDARVGVNPFVPVKPKKLDCQRRCANNIYATLILPVKLPFVIVILIIAFLLHALKYILYVPSLVRMAERIIDWLIFSATLQVFGAVRVNELLHNKDKDFDFIKAKKGELIVDRNRHVKPSEEPTLILANDTSVLEYLWFESKMSPLFVRMDMNSKGDWGLRPLSGLEHISHACGISLPATLPDARLFGSFKAVRESRHIQNRPIVFFPECTRTNGKGVLEIPKEAASFINAAIDNGFKVHSFRFDYKVSSAKLQPYNSTDVRGLWHAASLLTKFNTKMQVQYLFNLEANNELAVNKKLDQPDLSQRIKASLFSSGREYSLDKDW